MKTQYNLPTPEDFAQTIARSMWGPSLQNKPYRSHLDIIAERSSLPSTHNLPSALTTTEPQGSHAIPRPLGANTGSTAFGVDERTFAICAKNGNSANMTVRFDRHPTHNGLVWAAVKK